ncbi:MAG: hypothetical protein IJA79_05635, partial [Desulfovibrio sp.]|nr:hypothetical protein [Desulfovibrio sp.]
MIANLVCNKNHLRIILHYPSNIVVHQWCSCLAYFSACNILYAEGFFLLPFFSVILQPQQSFKVFPVMGTNQSVFSVRLSGLKDV